VDSSYRTISTCKILNSTNSYITHNKKDKLVSKQLSPERHGLDLSATKLVPWSPCGLLLRPRLSSSWRRQTIRSSALLRTENHQLGPVYIRIPGSTISHAFFFLYYLKISKFIIPRYLSYLSLYMCVS
jgi:hypothetical protein